MGYISPVNWIQSLFSRVKISLCLEEIEIHMNVRIPSPLHSEPGLDWSRWKDLDRLLARVEFSRLREFAMFLDMEIGYYADAEGELRELGDQLSALRARGILCITKKQ